MGSWIHKTQYAGHKLTEGFKSAFFFFLFCVLALFPESIAATHISAICFVFYLASVLVCQPEQLVKFLLFYMASLLNLAGCYVIEVSNIYLQELSISSFFVGSFPLLVLVQWVFLRALFHLDLLIEKHLPVKESPSSIFMRRITDVLSLIALLLGILLFSRIAPNPAFVSGIDRFEFNDQYGGASIGMLGNVLSYLMVASLMSIKKGNRCLGSASLIVYVVYQIWIGTKFTAFSYLVAIAALVFFDEIKLLGKKKIRKVLCLLTAGLFACVIFASFIASFTWNINPIEYLSTRLAMQGQLWWRSYEVIDGTYHPDEFINEIDAIHRGTTPINENVGSNYGLYKIMYLTADQSQVDVRLATGSALTEAGFAAAYYYFGPIGTAVFSIGTAGIVCLVSNLLVFAVRLTRPICTLMLYRFLIASTSIIGSFFFADLVEPLSMICWLFIALSLFLSIRRSNTYIPSLWNESGQYSPGDQDIDVLILYEHKNRELESLLLIGELLRSKGASYRIAQIGWDDNHAISHIRPRVILVPWCYDDVDLNRFLLYRENCGHQGIDIVNLHCEQVVTASSVEFQMPKKGAELTYHCAWGEEFCSLLLDSGCQPSDISVTGSPRLDFFRPQFLPMHLTKPALASEFSLDSSCPWMLLIGFNHDGYDDKQLKKFEERGDAGISAGIEIAEKEFVLLVEWYRELCCSLSDRQMEIIYRPHPSELVSQSLIELEREFANFHIIGTHAIRDWLISTDISFSCFSTSSIEAFYAHKPTFLTRPLPIPESHVIPLVEHAPKITTVQDFIALADEVALGRNFKPSAELGKEISKYYSTNQFLACERTADLILAAVNSAQGKFSSCSSWHDRLKRRIVFESKIFLASIGVLDRFKRFSLISADRITETEIKGLTRQIHECLGLD